MSGFKRGISPEKFYGGKNPMEDKIDLLVKNNCNNTPHLPKTTTGLLGPSMTWKIFKKQQDAIICCLQRRNGLMPFAFEDVHARRMFLAAHPEVFWKLNSHRFFKDCNSYEIIREYSACKLYLDIEFEFEYNKNKNGNRMLDNILAVINYNLKTFFNISCTRNEILDLDSSSSSKYSHHVIYEIEGVAFQDNYAVGNFVKRICCELKEAFDNNNRKLLDISLKYNIPESELQELFVWNHKGEPKLLIDEGVYTKNRHFRLLGSSKKFKNVPLQLSSSNKYNPHKKNDLNYFLDSLITYFSWKVDRILEFGESGAIKKIERQHKLDLKVDIGKLESETGFMHQEIESFITSLISPKGRIRRKVFFSDRSTIVYDIQDFRYCENIGREHKSNNIKYIVDLQNLKYYQKCYDPDCSDFRSEPKHLPDEICFLFEDDSFLTDNFEEFSVEEFNELTKQVKCDEAEFKQSICDEDLENAAVCAEAMFDADDW